MVVLGGGAVSYERGTPVELGVSEAPSLKYIYIYMYIWGVGGTARSQEPNHLSRKPSARFLKELKGVRIYRVHCVVLTVPEQL